MSKFLKKKELGSNSMKIAADDGALVYHIPTHHTVQHNYSFHQRTIKSVTLNLSKGPV